MTRKITKKNNDNKLYEEIYPKEYKPGSFTGGLPHDPRICRIDWFVILEVENEKIIILGPKAIRWDVLEHIPNEKYAITSDFYIIEKVKVKVSEIIEIIKVKDIYRWSPRKKSWLRMAKGKINR